MAQLLSKPDLLSLLKFTDTRDHNTFVCVQTRRDPHQRVFRPGLI
ncbi:hypothetical protein KL86PLE_41369 [uncultured Pleomorphomonas sp.]|uniref:Uncharacterized protein n=1 Tax=uncultured Pleomorphomonas sp. TaxID=442121 RepID=A0A212LJ50_9HYPH|nr:hypothetical protein KL86PLE_41369 [uncultured Pleomorphomonas sp.]